MKYSEINILLIDDHDIVVEGCASMLRQSGFKSVSVETDCEKGLQNAVNNKPNLIIVDISMPGIGGLGLIRRIRDKQIDAEIIVFSMHDDPTIISRAMDSDVKGYVSKTSSPQKILEAIDSVMSGNLYLSQDVAQVLALDKLNPVKNILDNLTSKEYEIFDMLVNGNNISDIADKLFLSSKSVSNYITKIKGKLNVSTVAELVHIGYKHNITRLGTDVVN